MKTSQFDTAACFTLCDFVEEVLAIFDEHTPLGPVAYREGGAAWFERHGIRVAPSEVVVCNGGQHAMLVTLGVLAVASTITVVQRILTVRAQATATVG